MGTAGLIPSRGSITKTEMREREVTDWLGRRQASQPATPGTSRQVLLPVLAAASVSTMSSLLAEREGNSHREQHPPRPVRHLPLWFPGGFLSWDLGSAWDEHGGLIREL